MNVDRFITPLGTVELDILFKGNNESKSSEHSRIINTQNFMIEIIQFNDIKNWRAQTIFPIQDSRGWIIRINKITDDNEGLVITCKLNTEDVDIKSFPDSGEHLDAIWIENKTHFLSIGTEDADVLRSRAEVKDYMPFRFANQLGNWLPHNSFTEYLNLGFKTTLPNLEKNERLYLHFLVAINPRKKSVEYPDDDDISTNFAVDYQKRVLIEKLRIKE